MKFNQKLTRFQWLGVLLIAGMILAACAPAATQAPAPTAVPQAVPTTVAAAPTTAPVPVTSAEAALSVASDPKLGQILVGNNGRTVYAFTKDGPNQSTCTGKCAANWPAVRTQGSPQIGSGIDSSLVGSASLPDGTKLVTYNKMPLYYLIKDAKAGDVNGQGVGSVWFTISPDGKLVGQTAVSGTTSAAEPEASQPTEATINIATDPKLGKILVDGKGLTLYMFTKDTPDKATCTGGCAKAWPPLLTLGSPKLGPGVDSSMIGSATLPDGSKIVTYNHMPLYYFIQDKVPGDVKGQDNGNVWFVVSPDGKAVNQ